MRIDLNKMGILLAMAIALLGQDASAVVTPTLHPRPVYESEEDSSVATWKSGATVLPEDAAGFYRFRDDAQGVRIVNHDGDISGYLLKFGRGTSDKDLVLGYLFSDVAGSRNQLGFTTRPVHGVWYGFEGRVVQKRIFGQAGDSGYLLKGKLTMHDETQQTTQQDTVSLRFAGPR